MELHKINIDFKDMRPAQTQRNLQIDVIVIDRTVSGMRPMLYALKSEYLSLVNSEAIKRGFFPFDRHAYKMIGEVLSVNKRSKQVILANENSVTYIHLRELVSRKSIATSGSYPDLLSPAFLASFQTLVGTLRDNSPSRTEQKLSKKKNLFSGIDTIKKKPTKKIGELRPKVLKEDQKRLNQLLHKANCLPEVSDQFPK